ncbi:MAG: type II toxin-antitoxin system Phd/YefM family antitoxin, partial [Burkholderiales bacterium]|nr:type II toxin-antitoxin system Phd/YefM family antitoxin [Burkholderiales bacterium]
TCLSVLQRVKRSGRPVVVTRFGQPVAEIVPPQRRGAAADWLGSMAGTATIVGDVIAPAADADDWNAIGR